jgi:hypothetical protein
MARIAVGTAPGGHRRKTRGVVRCQGTRRVTLKTLPGAFACVVPRVQCPRSGAPPSASCPRHSRQAP